MLLLLPWVACTASDEVTESTPPESTPPENEAPTTPTISFAPEKPDTTDDITCVASAEDPEGGELTWTYLWTSYDTELGTDKDLSAELTTVSQQLTCTATATDPEGLASEPGSASVSITNAPPGLAEIAIEPSEPTTDDQLTCVIVTEAEDPDDHEVSYVYFWLEGENELDPGFVENTLDPELTAPGQTITCQVNAFDNIAYGEAVQTSVSIAP